MIDRILGFQKVKKRGKGRSEFTEKSIWLKVELPASLVEKLRHESLVEEMTLGEVIARHCGHLPRYK